MNWLCRIGLHRCDTVRDTGMHRYRVCRPCGKRQVTGTDPREARRLWQPWDRGWLETGKWTTAGPPPRKTR